MTGSDSRRLATLLSLEYERLLQHAAFATEVQRALREFFGPMAAALPSLPQLQRFREWLLLERESQTLGSQPWLLAPTLQDEALFEDSLAGLFLVERRSGRTAQVRDLQDQERLDINSEEHDLQQGDLVVGRMYAHGDGSLLPSAAVVVFRPGIALAAAFRADLDRLALERRLSQVEIEQLLLVNAARPQLAGSRDEPVATTPQLEHLEAELEQLFQKGGASYSATAISQVLRQAPRLGPALGELLEQMAFDTRVDLDRVRAVLLQMWNVLHPDSHPANAEAAPTPAGDEDLGEQLVHMLDDGLARGRDLDELFAELEKMAGIEPDAEPDVEPDVEPAVEPDVEPAVEPAVEPDDEEDGLKADGEEGVDDWRGDDDDDDADDDDDDIEPPHERIADLTGEQLLDLDPRNGDLAPLVQEFLWETGQQQTPTARTLQTLVELQQQSAMPHSDLEAVTGLDLTRMLLHVYLRSAPKERAGAVHAAFAVLQQFCGWAGTTQEYDLSVPLQTCRDSLVQHVDRLSQFGQHCSTAAAAKDVPAPCLMRVEDVDDHGFGVRVDGGDTFWIAADKAASKLLQEGDLLLASILPQAAGRGRLAGMVIALPQDAESLIG